MRSLYFCSFWFIICNYRFPVKPSLSTCRTKSKTSTCEVEQSAWWTLAGDSVDLLEISNGEHLLVVVDYYSRWLEAILLKKTDAQHVKKSMEAIFRTRGLPEALRSDNGPPFASKKNWGLPRIPWDKPQEGRTLLTAEQPRSGAWQWNISKDSGNCSPWRERLEKSTWELPLPV